MNKITHITIQQYLDGTLDKEAMHELEKEALNDPFLADALEGYSYSKKAVAPQLSLLQMQLEKRVAQQQENKNVLSFSWQRLSIAAAAGLLFVSATILLWMKTDNSGRQLAQQPKNIDVVLTPKDSLNASIDALPASRTDGETTVSSGDGATETTKATPKYSTKRDLPDQPVNSSLARVEAAPRSELNEAVIIGYGTQKRESFVGSVSRTLSLKIQDNPSLITGKVVSGTGQPLIGASVKVKGSHVAAVSNENGEFRLSDSVGQVLDINYIGYLSQQVEAKPGESITIALKEDPSITNATITVGYGQQKKERLVGSIATTSQSALPKRPSLLSGKVVSTSGEPLAGAAVKVQGSALVATTNTRGEFALKDSLGRVLTIHSPGFQPEVIKAQPGDPVTVALKESNILNQAVVDDFGKALPKLSVPAKGWDNFNVYIRQNLRMPAPKVRGSVTLSFTIDADNKPVNFVIKDGLSDKANKEAIRLIKEGPAWVRGQDSTVNITVSFGK